MLCDHLEGWGREGGREGDARGRRYGDILIEEIWGYTYTYTRDMGIYIYIYV